MLVNIHTLMSGAFRLFNLLNVRDSSGFNCEKKNEKMHGEGEKNLEAGLFAKLHDVEIP